MGKLRERWESLEGHRTRQELALGRDPGPVPAAAAMAWTMGARAVVEVLKATEPERILAAVWEVERDLDGLGREAAGRLVEEVGVQKLAEMMLGPPRDGDLDIRPPGRGG
jgi:hypothetical protein